jgi:hypothetical protein
MSPVDDWENVLIEEDPVHVSISDATPIVTITNPDTTEVTVVDNSVAVTVNAAKPPKVIVVAGGRGAWLPETTSDAAKILDLLGNVITEAHLSLEINADLIYTRDQLIRFANDIIRLGNDISIQQTAINTNKESIDLSAIRLDVHDGELDLARSGIQITADSINAAVLRVTTAEGQIVYQGSQILQAVDAISSHVIRFDTNETEITRVESLVIQSAYEISQIVSKMTLIDGEFSSISTRVSQTEDLISEHIIQLNTAENEINTLNNTLTSTNATLALTTETLDGVAADLTSVREMTSSQWSVSISEDYYGNKYATGFGLFLYPDWIRDRVYHVNDIVWFSSQAYKATSQHTSNTLNYPGTTGAPWIVTEREKSEFIVQADKFAVRTIDANGVYINPFTIVGNEVVINASVRILESETTPWSGVNGAGKPADNATANQSDTTTNNAIGIAATTANWSGISGAGKPANNATANQSDTTTNNAIGVAATTANWSGISNLPAPLLSPTGSGLFLNSNYMGYYKNGTWKTYMDKTGNFYLTGSGGHGLSWYNNTLTVTGDVIIQNASTVRTALNVANGADVTSTAINTGLDTTTGGIIVRNAITSNYAHLTAGDIIFYDYYNGQFNPYKSLKKITTGVCSNGDTVNIGYFRETPTIILSPKSLMSYNLAFPNQSQQFNLAANNLRKSSNNWYFDCDCTLELSTNSVVGPLMPFMYKECFVDFMLNCSYCPTTTAGPWFCADTAIGVNNVKTVSVNFDIVLSCVECYPVGHWFTVKLYLEIFSNGSWSSGTSVESTVNSVYSTIWYCYSYGTSDDQHYECEHLIAQWPSTTRNFNLTLSSSFNITHYRYRATITYPTTWAQDISGYFYVYPRAVTLGLASASLTADGQANYTAIG